MCDNTDQDTFVPTGLPLEFKTDYFYRKSLLKTYI